MIRRLKDALTVTFLLRHHISADVVHRTTPSRFLGHNQRFSPLRHPQKNGKFGSFNDFIWTCSGKELVKQAVSTRISGIWSVLPFTMPEGICSVTCHPIRSPRNGLVLDCVGLVLLSSADAEMLMESSEVLRPHLIHPALKWR